MKQKQTITYIKDGKETTITLNRFNQRFVFNKLFYNYPYDGVSNGRYKVRDEITYLEIKNYQFKRHSIITCINPETIIILDNCRYDVSIELSEGSYRLIYPTFIENKGNIAGDWTVLKI